MRLKKKKITQMCNVFFYSVSCGVSELDPEQRRDQEDHGRPCSPRGQLQERAALGAGQPRTQRRHGRAAAVSVKELILRKQTATPVN